MTVKKRARAKKTMKAVYESTNTLAIETLDELADYVQGIFESTGTRWWFRGHPDATWQLVPKVWRGYDPQTERYLTNLFYQRAKLRHASFPDDDDYASWLALMQHYGLPTRLLDWSDSAMIAAYFAVKYSRDIGGALPQGDACIWLLSPTGLNESQGYGAVFPSLNATSLEPLIKSAFKELRAPDGAAAPRLASRRASDKNKKQATTSTPSVLAAVPPNQDLRMVMQQGNFTVHTGREPLESTKNSEHWLQKIIIPRTAIPRLASSLDVLGMRLSDVFPDLSHLAIELTNMHRPSVL